MNNAIQKKIIRLSFFQSDDYLQNYYSNLILLIQGKIAITRKLIFSYYEICSSYITFALSSLG